MRAIREKENVHGSVYFSSRSLLNNLAGFADSLRTNLYRHPSLPPPLDGSVTGELNAPENIYPTVIDRDVRLRWKWEDFTLKNTYGFVVYRFGEGEPVRLDLGNNVIGIYYLSENFFFDTQCEPGKQYTYIVRPLDRSKNLGPPSEAVVVRIGSK